MTLIVLHAIETWGLVGDGYEKGQRGNKFILYLSNPVNVALKANAPGAAGIIVASNGLNLILIQRHHRDSEKRNNINAPVYQKTAVYVRVHLSNLRDHRRSGSASTGENQWCGFRSNRRRDRECRS